METLQETKPEVERKVSGFVYAPTTTKNFQRLKLRGIPLPPFRVEDNVTKMVKGIFDRSLAILDKIIIALTAKTGAVIHDHGLAHDNAMTDLLDYLRERLSEAFDFNVEGLSARLQQQLQDAQQFYFKEFFEDAPENLTTKIAFDLDHDQVFRQNIAGLRKNYVNNSIKRIDDGLQGLKKDFLGKLINWIEGNSDLNGIHEIMDGLRGSSERGARMFARDQFSKFNKSLSVSIYDQAGASHVKWMPVGDARTRHSHTVREMKKKYGTIIFPIDNLPEEKDDYQCRCGLLPVWDD